MILLCISWIPQTWDMIKTKKAYLNKTFILLYILGSGSLAIYSYWIKDTIFLALNSFIALMALLNGYYEMRMKWHIGKGRKHKAKKK